MKPYTDVILLWIVNFFASIIIQAKEPMLIYANIILASLSIIYMAVKIFISVHKYYAEHKQQKKK